MPDLRFAKGHGLGNDYIVVDKADLPWPLTTERIRAICDRHRGAGSDGILLADLEARPFALRIYNPDGSEAEKSGNGLRIFAAYLHRRGLVGGEAFRVRLPKDEVTLKVEGELPRGVLDISADMGRADFRGEAVGFAPRAEEALGFELPVDDGTVRVNPVSLANPHCVVLVDELRRDAFLRLGPRLATHPAFPAGTNVQFARVLGPRRLEAWIWERGAGETLASGSSACAVTAVATRLGLVERGSPVTVEMPGGSVEVTVAEDYGIRLRGPAQMVTEGVVLAGVVD